MSGFRSFIPGGVAEYSERPNRFIVLARTPAGIVKTHCPNPGRLREILLPGRKLILEKADKPERKTRWTLAAALYRDTVIPLVSARSNGLVGKLVLPGLFPGFQAESEQTLGKSRMDWLLSKGTKKIWTEVKACTLVEQGRALFPDAPSTRAVKHLGELCNPGEGNTAAVFFTVMNPSAKVFSPNPHTDPSFCTALSLAAESGVSIHALTVSTDEEGWSTVINEALPVDLSSLNLAVKDSGVILRVWEHPSAAGKIKNLYSVSYEYHNNSLSRAERRKVKHPREISSEYRLHTSFTIRGESECFKSMSEELSEMNFLKNPVYNAGFLDWVSDYRHRRVFLHQDSAGVVTPM